MTALHAVVFDVDGTLADTERDGHRPAFNAAFAEHGLDIVWEPAYYGRLLTITGGRRRIAHDLRSRGYDVAVDEMAAAVHTTKTRLFRDRILAGEVCARPGLRELVDDLRAEGIRVAIATTGTRAWVQPLIERLLGPEPVDVAVTGDDVQRLKPDPEVYLRALRELGIEARDALAVEDSAVGLHAAVTAGVVTVVVRNEYTAAQDFRGAAAVRDGFEVPVPLTALMCRCIHATATA